MSASSNNRSALAALAPVLAAVAVAVGRPARTGPAGDILAAHNRPALILSQLRPRQFARSRLRLRRDIPLFAAQARLPQHHPVVGVGEFLRPHVPLMPQPSTLVNS